MVFAGTSVGIAGCPKASVIAIMGCSSGSKDKSIRSMVPDQDDLYNVATPLIGGVMSQPVSFAPRVDQPNFGHVSRSGSAIILSYYN